MLIYVRTIREGHFLLYIEALTDIISWFFALHHTHYASWIPVHSAIYAEVLKGNFAVKKLRCAFSAIVINHSHEQNNADLPTRKNVYAGY